MHHPHGSLYISLESIALAGIPGQGKSELASSSKGVRPQVRGMHK